MQFPQNIFPLLIAYQIRIANNGAILFYSGNPGPGNLVGALSPRSGVDAFGNTYPQGYSLIMGGQQIVVGILASKPLIYWVTGNSHILNSGAIQAFQQGTGTTAFDLWQIIGPQSTLNDDMALIVISSSSDDGVTSKANLTLQYRDQALNFHAYERVDYAGVGIVAGSIDAVQPGTGLSSSNVAVAESWHALPLGAGWTTGSGSNPPLQYRMLSEASTVELYGYASFGGTPTINQLIGTLPSGWYNPSRVFVSAANYDTLNKAVVPIEITSGGLVELFNGAGLNANVFVSMRIHLGV